MDPTLITAAFASLERMINSALNYDPASQQRLRQLGDKTLHICCQAPAITAYVLLEDGRVHLRQHDDGPIDCQLKGSAAALAQLGLSSQHSLANSGVQVFGSTGLLIDLQSIARELDIDWEEPLSQLLGDVAGPSLAGLLRKGIHFLREREPAVWQRSGEALSEELRATPHPFELDDFHQAVDKVRDDSARLEAKAAKLKRRLDAAITAAKQGN
ncbi:ubiquinone biosynthesis accessory factor UbiJ [Pseudoteredinibacter isoporae]|uniref:ubiquinone biosynthesis accessory factor UbiJ n=1 Tax=Pseudoteredinibacter isoporae TaxID=570281 RepID=UPI003104B364